MNLERLGTGQPLLMFHPEQQVKANHNFQQDEFTSQSRKANAYWVTHLTK